MYNPHPLYGALPGRMCQWGLHAELWSQFSALMHLLAAEPRSIAGLLFTYKYLCGTVLVTSYLMVWDWRVLRAEPMPLYWPSCSLPFCLQLFSLSLLSFYGLVLWGWGLRSDMVLLCLPALQSQTDACINVCCCVVRAETAAGKACHDLLFANISNIQTVTDTCITQLGLKTVIDAIKGDIL